MACKTIEFQVEKDNYKNELVLPITKVIVDKAKITDKKTQNLAISKIGKKKEKLKWKLSILL